MELETQRPCEECQRKQDLIDTFEMEANAASANQDEDEKAWHEFMGGPHYATPTLREAWDAAIHARNRKLLNPTLPHKPANIWIGTSCENQEWWEKRREDLIRIPAKKHFVSMEPLLGPINCETRTGLIGIDWVIVGGESGPKARPCNVEWIRLIIRQCKAAGVPCFVKQLGRNPKWSDKDMEEKWYEQFSDPIGGNMDEWPFDLRVRQFPKL